MKATKEPPCTCFTCLWRVHLLSRTISAYLWSQAHCRIRLGQKKFSSHVDVVNYLFQTYAVDVVFARTDPATVRYNQPRICRRVKLQKRLWLSRLDVKRSTVSTSWRESSSKSCTNPSGTDRDHTRVRIQRLSLIAGSSRDVAGGSIEKSLRPT